MTNFGDRGSPIHAGDIDGLGRIYSRGGDPILGPEEDVLVERKGCDFAAYGSWRMFFAKRIFRSLPGEPSGSLLVTSERILFFRDIEVWKEVKPLLTPLGLPAAAEKEARLKELKAVGARQYCEVNLSLISQVEVKRKPWLLRLRVVGSDGGRYELFLHTEKEDPRFMEVFERIVRQRIVSARHSSDRR